jgi:hypothetical protein
VRLRSAVQMEVVLIAWGAPSDYMIKELAKREQMSPSNLQAAIQEEQNRLYRFLHDRMSPKIMEMAFLVET